MKATALEILSEPLTLLVTLAALVVTIIAPVFHYHQFGEPTRMARDAGLSSLLMCGSILAVFSTIRSFRREIESGTLEMALAHPISRLRFFLAKTSGAFLALTTISFVLFVSTLNMVIGADAGAIVAEKIGGLITVLGPFVVGGVALILLPMILAALLNRFARFRFVLSSMFIMTILAGVIIVVDIVFVRLDSSICSWDCRLLPMVILISLLNSLLLTAAAAFAVRFRANGAATACGGVFAIAIPFLGNFYPTEALAKGGSVDWLLVVFMLIATLPAIMSFLILGVYYARRLDH